MRLQDETKFEPRVGGVKSPEPVKKGPPPQPWFVNKKIEINVWFHNKVLTIIFSCPLKLVKFKKKIPEPVIGQIYILKSFFKYIEIITVNLKKA